MFVLAGTREVVALRRCSIEAPMRRPQGGVGADIDTAAAAGRGAWASQILAML